MANAKTIDWMEVVEGQTILGIWFSPEHPDLKK
jgi:hypothetical protein